MKNENDFENSVTLKLDGSFSAYSALRTAFQSSEHH